MNNEELVRKNMKGKSEEDIQKVIGYTNDLENELNKMVNKK